MRPIRLLQVHWVPRQIMIEQHASELQVDALRVPPQCNEDAWTVGALESALGGKLGPVVASFEYIHASVGEGVVDRGLQRIHAAEIRRENNNFLAGMHSPKIPERAKQFLVSYSPRPLE